MASAYLPDGRRIDHHLSLHGDGNFIWSLRGSSDKVQVTRGRWSHDQIENVLFFDPGIAPEPDPQPERWRVLAIRGLEEANEFMLLRQVAIGTRILPIVFYRVHLEDMP